MEVSHYFEFSDHVFGGIAESVKNQRKALESQRIDYTVEPDLSTDVLHLNLMGPRSVYHALRARIKGVPVVVHPHVTAEDFGESFFLSDYLAGPLKYYLRFAYSLADFLVCPSEHNRNVMQNYTDSPKKVISNGVDTSKLEGFKQFREDYLERYDLEPPVVFMVGHVFRRKGLEAFVETARDMPELDFAWFGPLDRDVKELKTQKLVKNAPENCTFTGYIEDIRGAFAAGDVFFFPTHEENEGIALLEAMAAGKPVVVRDIETFEWLEDGVNCLKSDSDFREELENMKDEDTREKIGENAMEKSREFELPVIGEELASVYREVTDA